MDYTELITKIMRQANMLVTLDLVTKDTTYNQITKFFKLFVTDNPINYIFVDKFNEACYTYLKLQNKGE
jgi:hypothetical protein